MKIITRHLGLVDYQETLMRMRDFTDSRNNTTVDQVWLVEHPPVFTQGQAGKAEHILQTSDIPIVQSDRGGQVTYHGPGQLIVYVLLDLKRRHWGIRTLVKNLEQCVINLLADYQLTAATQSSAPGVYLDNKKICSLGLRVRHGYSYHGLALNIDMDLEPFSHINPCGYQGLEMTKLSHHIKISFNQVCIDFMRHFHSQFAIRQQHV